MRVCSSRDLQYSTESTHGHIPVYRISPNTRDDFRQAAMKFKTKVHPSPQFCMAEAAPKGTKTSRREKGDQKISTRPRFYSWNPENQKKKTNETVGTSPHISKGFILPDRWQVAGKWWSSGEFDVKLERMCQRMGPYLTTSHHLWIGNIIFPGTKDASSWEGTGCSIWQYKG